MFRFWTTETHGVMGRLSDYGRTYITAWYGARKELGKLDVLFEEKITKYYEQARDCDFFVATAVADPQINRSLGR